MSTYSILPFVTGLYLLSLGLFIYLNNRKSILHISLASVCLSGVIWLFSYTIMYSIDNEYIANILARVVYVGIIFIPITYHHFTMRFLRKTDQGKVIKASYALGLIFLYMDFFTNLIVAGANRFFWGYQTKVGYLHTYFLLFFVFGLFTKCLYNLYVSYRINTKNRTEVELNRIKYVFWAFFLGNLGSIDFIPNYGIPIYPVGSINIVIYITILAYAILRHQLLDIEVIIKKTLVFAGLFAAVYVVFAFFALLSQLFFEKFFTANRWIAMLPSVVIVTMMLRPLENFLLVITNKFLFQKKFDYKELLKTFTAEVLTVLDLDRLVHLTMDKLVDVIKLNSCAVLLFDDESQQFNVIASHNIKDPQVTLIRPDGIVTFLEQTHGYLLKKELRQKKIFIPESIQEIIDKLNAELIIPMVLHQKVIGILSIGTKKSDEDYTQDDLDILLPLARTLAIAISNAQLFVELGITQAEAAQREKMAVIGTLSAGMAHEIRNPITTIKTFSEFLKEKKDDPEFIAKFERLVPKEVEKINYMIEHLLEFSRPADYKVIEPVNLREETKEVIEILQNEMVVNDIMLDEHVRELPLVSANKKYVQEIVFNLLRNAIHAIGRGGKVSISAEDKGERVEMEVKDTGCGMSEEQMAHIFQPFYTTKMNQKGVGLGLYIIKQLMNRMGGQVSVESSKGCGTAFRLEFAKYRSV